MITTKRENICYAIFWISIPTIIIISPILLIVGQDTLAFFMALSLLIWIPIFNNKRFIKWLKNKA
jgi:hypothetical protein